MVEQSEAIGAVGALSTTDTASSYDNSSSATPTAAPRQPSAQVIQDAVNQVNSRLSSVNRVLELNVDAGSGLTVATIRNSDTGEVLQQFPSANSIDLAKMLSDWAGGKNILLDLIA